MVQTYNILVFPCGSEIGLEVHAALKYEKSAVLFGASSVEDHGRMVYRNYTGGLPFIGDPGLDGALQALIEREKIDFIIPAHDSALVYLTENRDKFSAKVIAPSVETCRTCRSKRATYDALAGESFVPAYYKAVEDVPAYPVFMKPDVGQGSQGIVLACDEAACRTALAANPGLLMCEYLPGAEYTVDCYSNRDGELLHVAARERIRTKSGISVRSANVDLGPELEAIAQTISDRLKLHGVWFFQLKRAADGSLKLMEVAPRVAGTMALNRVSGVNYILLGLFEAGGFDVGVIPPLGGVHEVDRALASRFRLDLSYKVVYLDLDDTLIVHDRVHEMALLFLYQCRGKGMPVKLITRHFQEPRLTLAAHALHETLFEEIIWITDRSVPKSGFIREGADALFIDDSYVERRDVASLAGASVMAPDAIEALLDWRK